MSAQKTEWLIVVLDVPGKSHLREANREKHVQDMAADGPSWVFGGPILESPWETGPPPGMKGSAMIMLASSKEEVVARLQKDTMAESGIWDVAKRTDLPNQEHAPHWHVRGRYQG